MKSLPSGQKTSLIFRTEFDSKNLNICGILDLNAFIYTYSKASARSSKLRSRSGFRSSFEKKLPIPIAIMALQLDLFAIADLFGDIFTLQNKLFPFDP